MSLRKAEILELVVEKLHTPTRRYMEFARAIERATAHEHQLTIDSLRLVITDLENRLWAAETRVRELDREPLSFVAEVGLLRQDAQRWNAVLCNTHLQGSYNGYATFKQAVDACITNNKSKGK